MRLHITTIEKLISLFENYGGHRNQQRLKEMLAGVDLSAYERQTGESVLVLTEELEREKTGSK